MHASDAYIHIHQSPLETIKQCSTTPRLLQNPSSLSSPDRHKHKTTYSLRHSHPTQLSHSVLPRRSRCPGNRSTSPICTTKVLVAKKFISRIRGQRFNIVLREQPALFPSVFEERTKILFEPKGFSSRWLNSMVDIMFVGLLN